MIAILRLIAVMLCFFGCGWATYPATPTAFADRTNEFFTATDQNGHAMVAYTQRPSGLISLYYFSANVWTSMSLNGANGTVTGLAMSPSGTALLTYINSSFELHSLYYDGNVWIVPVTDPIGTVPSDGSGGGDVAMGDSGLGVVIWADTTTEIRSRLFSYGDWGPMTIVGELGTGGFPQIDINTNGGLAMIAGWMDATFTNVNVRHYIGAGWNLVLDNLGPGQLGGVAIGNGGARSIAVIKETTTANIKGTKFFGGTNQGTTTLNPTQPFGPGNSVPRISMGRNSKAVVTWSYIQTFFNQYDLYYAQFDENNWVSAVNFQSSTTISPTDPAVSLNSSGNGLLFWGNKGNPLQFYVARLPVGGSLGTPLLVTSTTTNNIAEPVSVSLANNGWFNVLAWGQANTGNDTYLPFGTASIQLAAPTGLTVTQCPYRLSSSQNLCSYKLTWDPTTDPNVASYNIERNGVFVYNVPVGDPQYFDGGNLICGETVVFSIAAVDLDGVPGIEAYITVN